MFVEVTLELQRTFNRILVKILYKKGKGTWLVLIKNNRINSGGIRWMIN
jgi:hypothetical protein